MFKIPSRRLWSVYGFRFFNNLILWYAIEKVIFSQSGIDYAGIIVLGIIAQASQVFLEVPTSILSDRWSRKKTLILSACFMLMATALPLFKQNYTIFITYQLLWAIAYALESGTVNAYLYDSLKEMKQEASYKRILSQLEVLTWAAILLAGLLATATTAIFDELTNFLFTLAPVSLALWFATRLREPHFHKTEADVSHLNHLRKTIAQVHRRRWLWWLAVAAAAIIATQFWWYEYSGIYYLDAGLDSRLFGMLVVIVGLGVIAGGVLAHRIPTTLHSLLMFHALAFGSLVGLATTDVLPSFVPIFILFASLQFIRLSLEEIIQHHIDSSIRATVLSLSNMGSRIIFFVAVIPILTFSSPIVPLLVASAVILVFALLYVFAGSKQLQHTYSE